MSGDVVQLDLLSPPQSRICLDCGARYPRVERPAFDGLCDECGARRVARVEQGLSAVPRARMTYRERRERRAERLREWAEKREQRAAAAHDRAHAIADQIPLGQPVLVGHHSEGRHRRDLARIDGAMGQAVEHGRMAAAMSGRADNIEAQLAGAIYSDDPDAVEQLRARIAGLEAERDRIKAYNASCRSGQPDESLLDERQRESLASVRRYSAYQLGKGGALPAYALSNLNGNLKRNRDRLAQLLAR